MASVPTAVAVLFLPPSMLELLLAVRSSLRQLGVEMLQLLQTVIPLQLVVWFLPLVVPLTLPVLLLRRLRHQRAWLLGALPCSLTVPSLC